MTDKVSCLGEHRLVHLDLKRAPVRVQYLEQLMWWVKSRGGTGLLLEWEDTFPYTGKVMQVGSNGPNPGYSLADVHRIHATAHSLGLLVVPLVQTFGHLEFVLKEEGLKEMREKSVCCLCPSHPESLSLVTTLIDQVAATLPPSSTYFHIGADEVWEVGVCEVCRKEERVGLLLGHVVRVLCHLRERHPTLQPLMWDDMLRALPTHSLLTLRSLVHPVLWIYRPAGVFSLPDHLWDKYRRVFGHSVWVASAFKGASGSTQLLPDTAHRVSNHEAWISHLTSHSHTAPGIILTGWSRYDHYACLCELLPTAIPCLALCLSVCLSGVLSQELHVRLSQDLGYKNLLPLYPQQRPQMVEEELKFIGWEACVGVERLANLKVKHRSIVQSDQVGTWLNVWQIKNNLTNPMHLEALSISLQQLVEEWNAVEEYLRRHLAEVYLDHTIEEYLYTQIHEDKLKATQLCSAARLQLQQGWSSTGVKPLLSQAGETVDKSD